MGNISSSPTTSTTAQSVPDMVAAIRFHPTEEEMADFLSKKMKSHDSQACHFLPVIDVCKFEPWDLPERMFPESPCQAKAWYSFSWCDYKYINSLHCNRITEQGFWKITGKPRDISSKYFTCKKRTLTFHKRTFQEGLKSKSIRTGWIIHEYYCTKPKRDSNPSQERDQQRDFVLCLLKYKPVVSKSDNKKVESTSIRDDLADPGNHGHIASSSGDDQAATANHDHGEPGAGISSDFIDQALHDMIQEWQSCALLRGYPNPFFPPPEPPQLHQPPQFGNAADIHSHELVDTGTGGCITYNSDNQAAEMNRMVPETEEILAYKQLRSVLASGDHDDGEPGGGISSDFNDQAVDYMIQEYCAQLEKDLDSPLSPPSPPQPHQPHQLGNVLDVHSSEFSNWTSPTGDNDSYVTNTNNIETGYENEPVINIAYNSQNHATNKWISEVYSQAEENRGSPLQPFDQLQNHTLQSPKLFSEPGEFLHANNYIGCNELQSLDMETATLFPQSS